MEENKKEFLKKLNSIKKEFTNVKTIEEYDILYDKFIGYWDLILEIKLGVYFDECLDKLSKVGTYVVNKNPRYI